MRQTLGFVGIASIVWVGSLCAQTPTITAVFGEDGQKTGLCPGGVAFVQGSNLGGNGAGVTVGGKQAYVLNGNNQSLQFQLPVDAPLGPTTLTVGGSAPFNITLARYAPGVATDGLPDNLAGAFHYPSLAPVTFTFPASPNEQIAVTATGLGPTNPVYATGTAPTDNSAAVITTPTVSVAGKSATVAAAFLEPRNPGFYLVVFTVPASATTGNQNISVSTGGFSSNTAILPVATGPVIGIVTNAASYIDPSLPNGPIAQGSIFTIKGNNLGPSAISIAANAFQNTSLSGTSMSVTINGTTVAPLMYYTSALQVAALLPSNTPVGTGVITVTYNGQTGPTHPITVVANNLGIFTVTSDGQGAGIVTYPDYSLVSTTKAANCGGVNTTCGAANPGDTLIVWATGLGPVNGSDAAGAGLGVNMTSIPTKIWLGNVQVPAIYQGRSGCCAGEDQIVFTVPANTPTGCAVPLSVQINNSISNNVALPVAPAGTRTCTPANLYLTAANVTQASSGAGAFTFAGIDLKRQDNYPGFQDVINGQFLRFTIAPATQPFFVSYVDAPALGTCQVFNNLNGNNGPPLTILAGLDAGPQLTVQGPNGSKSASGGAGSYNGTLGASGNYFAPGTITVSSPGGADVSKFSASIVVPAMPTMTSPPPDATNNFAVTRSSGLTVTWSGTLANGYIELDGSSATDGTYTNGASFQCTAAASSGSFTIPPSVLLALPAGNFGGLDFRPVVAPVSLTGSGLDFSYLALQYDFFATLSFK